MVKFIYILAILFGAWAVFDYSMASNEAVKPYFLPPPAETVNLDKAPKQELSVLAVKVEPELPIKPREQQAPSIPTAAQYQPAPVSKPAAAAKQNATKVCPAPRAGDPSTLLHFGQPVRLNGANLAWSRDEHYAKDVGTDFVDLRAFREKFAQISAAGGNSARWWMHTNGTTTPNISPNGQVLGLSSQQSNQQVVNQVRAILDAAWAEGILLNITLFSFDFMCQSDRLGPHATMLNQEAQSYIDNALTPLVRGLKDHPALFAWEIFNESEGMAIGSDFFGDPNLQNCSAGRPQPTQVFQRFVNLAAARIHALDPNVKVTTSVGHPYHLKDYTNQALLSNAYARPSGVLDFYQIHWYSDDYNPFEKTWSSFGVDRPVVVGEYAVTETQNARRLLQNGYAGAWMWAQTSESGAKVSRTIRSGKFCAPRINKAAIETCIRSKSRSCYK